MSEKASSHQRRRVYPQEWLLLPQLRDEAPSLLSDVHCTPIPITLMSHSTELKIGLPSVISQEKDRRKEILSQVFLMPRSQEFALWLAPGHPIGLSWFDCCSSSVCMRWNRLETGPSKVVMGMVPRSANLWCSSCSYLASDEPYWQVL